MQGVDRAVACDEVWLAARLSTRERGRERDARFRNLCRRLGFGLLGVRSNGEVELLVSPSAPMPRKNPRRRSRLIKEHCRRRGDPVEGGGSRAPIMTACRQHALTCAAALAQAPRRIRDLKAEILDAPKILHGNVYDWFVPIERGVYTLTESGRAALLRWPQPTPPTAVDRDPLQLLARPRTARSRCSYMLTWLPTSDQSRPSLMSHKIALHIRSTLSRICCLVAVQTKGVAFAL